MFLTFLPAQPLSPTALSPHQAQSGKLSSMMKEEKKMPVDKSQTRKKHPLTFVKSNARSESAKYYLTCILFSETKSLKKMRWKQTQPIERHITCILFDIESRSLRISCRFFVPRMFLNVVWASSLIG